MASGRIRHPCNLFPELDQSDDDADEATDPHLEDPPESASPYRAGAIVAGKYRLIRQLGRGGMGEVWCAEHLALNTEVAVKFLSTGTAGHVARVALERFRFEAQVSAHLGLQTSHVVSVHDAGSDAVGPYLVMEHVRGHTLRAELTRHGQIELTRLASIIDQVAEALSVAHEFGIVHRDLKPSNLLLLEQPSGSVYVKVADFGIAKAVRADLGVDVPEDTSDGWMLGSPAYMSPEQTSGGSIDPRSDLWALGVIAYEALTGQLPFPGRSVAEIVINISAGRFDLPSRICPSLPVELDEWFLRALARRKEHRFGSVAEMAREFRSAIAVHPLRWLPRVARALVIATSLAAAPLALKPLPSDGLSEAASAALPAAMMLPVGRSALTGDEDLTALSSSNPPPVSMSSANQAATVRPFARVSGVSPGESEGTRVRGPETPPRGTEKPAFLAEPALSDKGAESTGRPAAPVGTKRRVLTEAF